MEMHETKYNLSPTDKIVRVHDTNKVAHESIQRHNQQQYNKIVSCTKWCDWQ